MANSDEFKGVQNLTPKPKSYKFEDGVKGAESQPAVVPAPATANQSQANQGLPAEGQEAPIPAFDNEDLGLGALATPGLPKTEDSQNAKPPVAPAAAPTKADGKADEGKKIDTAPKVDGADTWLVKAVNQFVLPLTSINGSKGYKVHPTAKVLTDSIWSADAFMGRRRVIFVREEVAKGKAGGDNGVQTYGGGTPYARTYASIEALLTDLSKSKTISVQEPIPMFVSQKAQRMIWASELLAGQDDQYSSTVLIVFPTTADPVKFADTLASIVRTIQVGIGRPCSLEVIA